MNTNPQPHPQQSALEYEEIHFLGMITKELSLENPHDAIKLVTGVLQSLRQTLALEDAATLLNRLPDFLKLAFASNWEQNEKQVHIEHLDEFVCLVMDRDKQMEKNLFKDEVQTLNVIILTLKGLAKIIDLENFEGVSSSLRQELGDIFTEATA